MMMNKSSGDLNITQNNNNNSSSSTSSSTCSSNHNEQHLLQLGNNNNNNNNTRRSLLDTTLLDSPASASPSQHQQQIVPTSSNAGLLQHKNTIDAVWNNIVAARPTTSIYKQEVSEEMMTLEDFLAKAAAVDDQEEDIKIPLSHLHLPTDRLLSGRMLSFDNPPNLNVDHVLGLGTGVDEMMGSSGKRRAILEPLDKAAQQRQRRMIKNRESAARSRERKQAYQAEMESLALKLEEENQTLMKAKEEQTKKRYKQLMDNIIPVTEKQRPTRYVMRKVRSMEW